MSEPITDSERIEWLNKHQVAMLNWLESEILDDEGAMINARDHGEWERYHRLDGHKSGLLHVVHHIRAEMQPEK